MLTLLDRQIPRDSCEVLLFIKTSRGQESLLWGRDWSLVPVARGPRVLVCAVGHLPECSLPALSQGHSQAGFGIYAEPGDELTDVEENKSVGFPNRWCSIFCAFGHFTK